MRKMLILAVIAAILVPGAAYARVVESAYRFEVEPGGSIVAEGSIIDAYETTITFTNPTADRAIVVPDAAGTLLLSGNALSGTTLTTTGAGVIGTTLAVGGAIGYTDGILISSGDIISEGATQDAYETTISFSDTTSSDKTITMPDQTGTAILSPAGAVDVTSAVSGVTGGIEFEGATADVHETTLGVVDPTGTRSILLPDASGTLLYGGGPITGSSAAIVGAITGASLEVSGAVGADSGAYTGGITGAFATVTGKVRSATTDTTTTATANAVATTTTVAVGTSMTVGTTASIGGAVGYSDSVLISGGTAIFEGSTQDAHETTLDAEEPTLDTTFVLPQALYAGTIVPVMGLGADATTYTITNSTADAQSLTIASGTFSAGKMVRITFAGTVVGTNAAKSVNLYVDDGIHGTLTIAAGTAGDFMGTFVIAEHTDFANQSIYGTLQTVVPADGFADFVTDTTDFNDGGDTVVKLQIISGHGSDSIQIFHSFAELIQ